MSFIHALFHFKKTQFDSTQFCLLPAFARSTLFHLVYVCQCSSIQSFSFVSTKILFNSVSFKSTIHSHPFNFWQCSTSRRTFFSILSLYAPFHPFSLQSLSFLKLPLPPRALFWDACPIFKRQVTSNTGSFLRGSLSLCSPLARALPGPESGPGGEGSNLSADDWMHQLPEAGRSCPTIRNNAIWMAILMGNNGNMNHKRDGMSMGYQWNFMEYDQDRAPILDDRNFMYGFLRSPENGKWWSIRNRPTHGYTLMANELMIHSNIQLLYQTVSLNLAKETHKKT